MITWKNYEEYIMMHADGELSADEELALEQFIAEHPELKAELAAYESARLLPDETIVYADKVSLIKRDKLKGIIDIPKWQKYGIAAGIALLVFVSIFKWDMPGANNTLAVSTTTLPLVNPPMHTVAPATHTNSVTAVSPNIPVTTKNQQLNIIKPKQNGKRNDDYSHTATAMKNAHKKGSNSLDSTGKVRKMDIDELPLAVIKTLPVTQPVTEIPSLIEVPEYEISAEDSDHKRSFLDRLQLDEANRHQLKTIARIASGTVQGVSSAKQVLDDKAITVNIKNNTIRISL